MLTKLTRKIYQGIRKHGKLSPPEAAAAIGRDRQIVYRIEGEENQLLTSDQEERLVRRANLSKRAFVEIMCKVLSKFLGQAVIIAPQGRYFPSSPLARAGSLFNFYEARLPLELAARIRNKLNSCVLMETGADQMASICELEVHQLIEGVVGPVDLDDFDFTWDPDEDEDEDG